MSYQTTIGWSLFTSGVVVLLLAYLPGDSVWYGIGLLVLGIVVGVSRFLCPEIPMRYDRLDGSTEVPSHE